MTMTAHSDINFVDDTTLMGLFNNTDEQTIGVRLGELPGHVVQ